MPHRLEFSPADVARVTVESSLGPFAETILAYSNLLADVPARGREDQRDRLRAGATGRDRAMASFLWLSRSSGIDLFSVVDRTWDLRGSRVALLAATGDEVVFEAEHWAWMQNHARELGLPAQPQVLESSSLAGLRSGTLASREALFEECADFYRRSIDGRWPAINNHLQAAQARLEECLVVGGVEGLIRALRERVRWTGSTLDLPYAGVLRSCTTTRRLDGRPLRIIPSFFALEPQAYWPMDPTASVLLIVPTRRAALPDRDRAVSKTGSELLGRTRTAVLATIKQGSCTTSELADRLDIAVSGASQHASVLRRGGLITTVRNGGSVVHHITGLGEDLLRHIAR